MKTKIIKQLLIFFAFASPLFSYCQQNNHTKILGTWAFTKVEFTKPYKDSLTFMDNLKGMILTIEKENKIIMKQKVGDEIKVMRTGTYTLSEDGKSFFQNQVESQILTLTDEELVLKGVEDGFIVHLKKTPN